MPDIFGKVPLQCSFNFRRSGRLCERLPNVTENYRQQLEKSPTLTKEYLP